MKFSMRTNTVHDLHTVSSELESAVYYAAYQVEAYNEWGEPDDLPGVVNNWQADLDRFVAAYTLLHDEAGAEELRKLAVRRARRRVHGD